MITAKFEWCFFHKSPPERIEAEQTDPHHKLVLVTQGLYDVTAGGETVQAAPGDVVLLRARRPRRDANVAGSGLEFLVVAFAWEELPDAWPLRLRDVDGRIRLLAHWLHERWWWGNDCEANYTTALLHAILAEYQHAHHFLSTTFVRSVRAYIDAHLDADLTTESLASAFNMSRASFSRRFKGESGNPPMQTVRQARMAHARYLLQSTGLPLKAVAEAIGLADEVSLCHFFNRYVGITPGEMREFRGQTKYENQTHIQGLNRCD